MDEELKLASIGEKHIEMKIDSPEAREYALEKYKDSYFKICDIISKYCDLEDKHKHIVALWILGTYVHDSFNTFPLLYINAVKGSGKSRLLKLIKSLCYRGKIVIDLREASLFRTAKTSTICIDEFEGVGSKEAGNLRTLLNAAYKKGATVERQKKIKDEKGQEVFVTESYDLYTGVVMANISGMDNILGDRAIKVVLDKSNKPHITKLIEDFETNQTILDVKRTLYLIQCRLCSVATEKNIVGAWNDYILSKTTLYTLSTTPTPTPLTTPNENIFKKISETNIEGRSLELYFPLLILSSLIDEEQFDRTLNISKELAEEHREDEYSESKDIALLDFISKKVSWRGQWKSLNDVCVEFKTLAVEDIEESRWISSKWVLKALTRWKLINKKRRVSKGIEIILDIDKAIEKIPMFKEKSIKNE